MNNMHKANIDWLINPGGKTKGWVWNTVTGCLNHCLDLEGEPYCYAETYYHRFGRNYEPTFHEEMLFEPLKLKKPSMIFICSAGELFGKWTYRHLINKVDHGGIQGCTIRTMVFNVVSSLPQHIFVALTKCSKTLRERDHYPSNLQLGVSIDKRIRLKSIDDLLAVDAKVRVLSFEPLLEKMEPSRLEGIQWVIIGGKSGRHPFHPPKEWVDQIIRRAREAGAAVFVKDNAGYPDIIREFPKRRN